MSIQQQQHDDLLALWFWFVFAAVIGGIVGGCVASLVCVAIR